MDIQNVVSEFRNKGLRKNWDIGTRTETRTITIHYNGPATSAAGNPARERLFLEEVAKYHMRKDAFGPGSDGNGIMYHYAILSNGQVIQMRSDDEMLWHSGDKAGNTYGLAIFFPLGGSQVPSEAQWKSCEELLVVLCERYNLAPHAVLYHGEWHGTDCPGKPLTDRVIAWRSFQGVTEDSAFLANQRAQTEQMIKYILSRKTGEYTKYDVESVIVPLYVKLCDDVGLDPTLLVAQMIHETDNLNSFWAARPQRNPAGIGVTGQASTTDPDQINWKFNEDRQRWEYGLSFASWENAIHAHVGRILAYAVARPNELQKKYIDLSLALRPLPASYRGIAPTLRGLNKRWATGDGYAKALAKVANAIITTKV